MSSYLFLLTLLFVNATETTDVCFHSYWTNVYVHVWLEIISITPPPTVLYWFNWLTSENVSINAGRNLNVGQRWPTFRFLRRIWKKQQHFLSVAIRSTNHRPLVYPLSQWEGTTCWRLRACARWGGSVSNRKFGGKSVPVLGDERHKSAHWCVSLNSVRVFRFVFRRFTGFLRSYGCRGFTSVVSQLRERHTDWRYIEAG